MMPANQKKPVILLMTPKQSGKDVFCFAVVSFFVTIGAAYSGWALGNWMMT